MTTTSPSILLIDDSTADRELMAMAVVEFGLDLALHGVGSLAEAMIVLGSGFRPDLVVTDLHLEGGDGCRVVAQLRQLRLPVAVITTSCDATQRERCLAAGASAFWVKPARFSALRILLAQVRALACGRARSERRRSAVSS